MATTAPVALRPKQNIVTETTGECLKTNLGTIAWQLMLVGNEWKLSRVWLDATRDVLKMPCFDAPVGDSALHNRLSQLFAHWAAGKQVDFSDVSVTLGAVSPFRQRVSDQCRKIGWGQTLTYGELAAKAGSPAAARAVGRVMATNPVPLVVPCHRVLGAGNALGGFSAPGGLTTKQRLLDLERS